LQERSGAMNRNAAAWLLCRPNGTNPGDFGRYTA
jgi:hypothetical protein